MLSTIMIFKTFEISLKIVIYWVAIKPIAWAPTALLQLDSTSDSFQEKSWDILKELFFCKFGSGTVKYRWQYQKWDED